MDRYFRANPILTPETFQRSTAGKAWRCHPGDRLYVDLSRVQFADFFALAEVALLVEGGARRGAAVEVAQPLARPNRMEAPFFRESTPRDPRDPFLRRAEDAIRRRRNARQFMEQVGFIAALQASHLPADSVTILGNYDPLGVEEEEYGAPPSSTDEDAESSWMTVPRTELLSLRRILPFQWISPEATGSLLNAQHYGAIVRELQDVGVSRPDAQAIVGTMLHELVDNVRRFASEGDVDVPPHALLGAVVEDTTHCAKKAFRFRPALSSYIRWIADQEGTVLQLVVGDSGRGWAAEKPIPFVDGTTHDGRQQASGLAQAARLIGSYRGAGVIRSGGFEVALTFRDNAAASPEIIQQRSGALLPGTLIRTLLLPDSPDRGRALSGIPTENDAQGRSVWVRCTGHPEDGLSNDDVAAIKNALLAGVATGTCAIATVEPRHDSIEWSKDVALNLLERAHELATFGTLAIVLPNVSWRSLDGARDSLHAIGANDEGRAAFVVDLQGQGKYCGGPQVIRDVMLELFKADGQRLTPKELGERRGLEDPLELIGELRKHHGGFLQVDDDDNVILCLSPADVTSHLLEHIGTVLSDAVRDGRHLAVRNGRFRSPTLTIVNRWVNADALADDVIGPALTAFALARRTEIVVSRSGDRVDAVAQLAPSPDRLAREFSVGMGVRSRTTIPEEFAALDLNAVRVSAGSKVALVTDVIASGNSVKRAIAEVTSRTTKPVVIACLLDGRESHEPIDVLGRHVPVASLATFNLHEHGLDDRAPVNIDPVTRDDEVPEGLPYEYPLGPRDFLQTCEAHPGVVRLGHIERPVAGHFSVYVNAGPLLTEDPTFGKAVIDNIVDSFQSWWKDLKLVRPGKQTNVAVWFPLTSDDLARELAIAVQQRLATPGCHVETRSISRAPAGSEWTFPLQFRPLKAGTDVLVIDWRALAGITLPQMMRLAVDSGARSIYCAVVLSHLDHNAEGMLRQVSALQPANGKAGPSSKNGTTKNAEVPTAVRFLTWIGSGRFPPSECPICHERDRYGEGAIAAPTELLRERASATHRALRPYPRDDLGEELRDLYEVRVTPQEVTAFLDLRSQLQAALRLTSERERIRSRLQELVAEVDAAARGSRGDGAQLGVGDAEVGELGGAQTTDGDSDTIAARDATYKEVEAWIRVLAVERQWLRLPPLRYGSCRSMVAALAEQVLADSAEQVSAIGIRRQALVVLSTAQPDTFIDRMPQLFRRCRPHADLLDDLLYETYAFLLRWVSQSGQQLSRILDVLKNCQDLVDEARQERRFDEKQALDYSHTLSSLGRMAESHLAFEEGQLTAQAAWLLLRQDYEKSIARHNDELHLWIDKVAVTVHEAPDRSDAWASALDSWQRCQDFLARNVLRFLPPLRDILLSERYVAQLTPDAHDWFADLLNETDRRRGVAGDMLLRLAKNPDLAHDAAVVDECDREITNWIDFFLSEGGGGTRRARLLEILSRCPCDLATAIGAAVTAARLPADRLTVHADWSCSGVSEVFCDGDLLKATFSHLIGNVIKRPKQGWQQPHRLEIAAEVDELSQRVTVTIKNDGTTPSDKPGHGYATLNRGLSVFGCALSGEVAEEPWTYEARLQLPLIRADASSTTGARL